MRGDNQIHPVDRQVGERLKTYRRARGLTQSSMGNAVGLTFQQIQKYESGRNRVSASMLHDIAKFLGVPVASFFDDDISPSDEPTTLLMAFSSIKEEKCRQSILGLVQSLAAG